MSGIERSRDFDAERLGETVIRQATPADREEVLELLDELGEAVTTERHHPDHQAIKLGKPIYDEIIRGDTSHILVAERNDRLIGVVTLNEIPNLRHGWHRGEIEDIVVSEDARSEGVGSQLLEAAKAFCTAKDIKIIKVNTRITNKRAQDFYRRNGGENTETMFRFDL